MSCLGALRRLAASVAAVLLAVSLWPAGASAERYALLVGVSQYDNLGPSYQLKGPANDVELLSRILPSLGFAPANIRVLAEAPFGSARPTRAAVLSELDRLAKTAGSGDYVYIHFSGHGSRQVAPSALPGIAESGGLQDIFLPADVGRWDGGAGTVVNAITSREFGKAVRRIRARGAFVWAVFDSCHSGAIVRALPTTDADERERQVQPADLGVPDWAAAGRTAPGQDEDLAHEQEDRGGGFVGFFAAQSDEATVEMHLPRGGGDSKVHGLFTFTLVQALTSSAASTYRALSESLIQRYLAMNRLFPTPSFEGDGLDVRVFGREPGKIARYWRLLNEAGDLEIEAGTLHQLSEGSILAVLPDPGADDGQIEGYLEIVEADFVRSRLVPVAYGGMPALDPQDLPEQAITKLVRPKWTSTVRIALPPRPASTATAVVSEAYRLLEEMAEHPEARPGQVQAHWVDPEDPADIRLMLEHSGTDAAARLWLLPPSGDIVRSGSLQTPGVVLQTAAPDLHARLLSRIGRAVRALTLERVLEEVAAQRSRPALTLNVSVRRANIGKSEQLTPERIPVLRDGDEIMFTVVNQRSDAIDVTMLYLDSEDRISVLYPAVTGGPNRIEQYGRHSVRVRVSTQTTGIERLAVIARPALPLAPRSDFSFLADEGAGARGVRTEPSRAASVFDQAGLSSGDAREIGEESSDQIDASVFPLRIEKSN